MSSVTNTTNGTVYAEENPSWLSWIAPESFNNSELFRIVIFFVFHSPCKGTSAMGKTLQQYGWSNPWTKPQALRTRLTNASSKSKEKGQLLFAATNYNEMEETLRKAHLYDNFPSNYLDERIAFHNATFQGSQFLNVFRHIRNAFAHGRINMVDIGLADDYAFVLEDVTSNPKKVSARMILRKSTLINWINLIEDGKGFNFE